MNRQLQIREAVMSILCQPLSVQYSRLWHLTADEWQSLLHWLDISGLALYFLDRLFELQLTHLLPQAVMSRLEQNLADNSARMRAMIKESSAIHRAFQGARLSYVTLKGFSLWPDSVPKLELRSQLDLDFLVASKDVETARHLLEARGYRLRAISGRSWEFKTDASPGASLKNLYKEVPSRCVELHVAWETAGRSALLARAECQCFYGIFTPVLSPPDLLLGQGLHLYKHVCSEFSRAAHLLEFRRNVVTHYQDLKFWSRVKAVAEEQPGSAVALGVVILLISQVMGEFAPQALTSWTVPGVPAAARLWIDLYGYRSVFASFPGNKLYLLLQRELATAGVPSRRPLRRALIPLRLPPSISPAAASDSFAIRLRRYRVQFAFVCFRLRFHLVHGAGYAWESLRWRQRMRKRQSSDNLLTCS